MKWEGDSRTRAEYSICPGEVRLILAGAGFSFQRQEYLIDLGLARLKPATTDQLLTFFLLLLIFL
jgi:hypothetical protein